MEAGGDRKEREREERWVLGFRFRVSLFIVFFSSGVLEMSCLDCVNPRRKDLNKRKIDDSAQVRSRSRFSVESSSGSRLIVI